MKLVIDVLFMASDLAKENKQLVNSATSSVKSYHTIKSFSSSRGDDTAYNANTNTNSNDCFNDDDNDGDNGSSRSSRSSGLENASRESNFNRTTTNRRESETSNQIGDTADNFLNISSLMSDKNKYRTRYAKDI